ncbi:MAG: HAD hydrolase family protein [Tepidisphaeraceae bacterium]|jgi:Cof subfamily protein (haloacid dehalogenase superfamily)
MTRNGYAMIGIDLDGTLLSTNGRVTPRTRGAIHNAVAAGMVVCFATGRSWRESCLILDESGHFADAVFVTGAIVADTRGGRTLRRRLMGPELARQVSAFFEKRRQTVLALQDSPQPDVDYLVTEAAELNVATQLWIKMTRTGIRRHGGLALAPELGKPHTHENTVRISIVADAGDVDMCMTGLAEEFGPKVACHCLVVPSSGLRVLEVFEPAVNKWDGLMHVADANGITAERIIAVGDDVNDLPMIRNAGLGIAMANAPAEVRAAADRVIGPNGEDGLAVFLEELLAG